MLRTIAAVLLGYIVMFVVVFVLMTAAYLGLGAERAFRPSSYEVSGLWTGLSILIGLAAAVGGGIVAAKVARGKRGVLALAIVVVLLGLFMAIPTLNPPDAGAPALRDGSVGNLAAMQRAKTPPWLAFLNPVIGAAGVFVGARLVRGKEMERKPAVV